MRLTYSVLAATIVALADKPSIRPFVDPIKVS